MARRLLVGYSLGFVASGVATLVVAWTYSPTVAHQLQGTSLDQAAYDAMRAVGGLLLAGGFLIGAHLALRSNRVATWLADARRMWRVLAQSGSRAAGLTLI